MRFTIGYINHNEDVFNKYLGPSLKKLKGEFDLIKTSDKKTPSINYNKILKKSKNRFNILTHQDISFSENLLERIEDTINKVDNYGLFGLVGVDTNKKYYWSCMEESFELQTLDSCFVVIDNQNEIFFDEKTFDDYHLYVEDFCMQTKEKTGKNPKTLLITKNEKSDSYLCHHSNTLKRLGPQWGKYKIYKQKLINKWGDVKTT